MPVIVTGIYDALFNTVNIAAGLPCFCAPWSMEATCDVKCCFIHMLSIKSAVKKGQLG